MRTLLIAALSLAGMAAAQAQQMDHSSMPMPGAQTKPAADKAKAKAKAKRGAKKGAMAGHDMKAMRKPKRGGALAGHDMNAMRQPQRGGAMAGHDMNAMGGMPAVPLRDQPQAPPPPAAFSGPKHAADLLFDPRRMAEAREELRIEQGDVRAYLVLLDRLETIAQKGGDGYRWDMQAWYGGDINKLWFKTEGNGVYNGKLEEGEVQLLWNRSTGVFFDLQAGVRYDFAPTPTRTHFAFGVQAFMPFSYNLEATMFVSNKGELTGRMKAEYDQRITQRLIIQPRIEMNLSAQNMPDIGVGSGLSSVEAGLRLRYEFIPEFAPYVGVEFESKIGTTAAYARAAGEPVDLWRYVAGVRAWF